MFDNDGSETEKNDNEYQGQDASENDDELNGYCDGRGRTRMTSLLGYGKLHVSEQR